MARKWEITTREELHQAAGRLRSQAKAQFVLVITDQDVACSIDEKLEPYDVMQMLRSEAPRLLQYLIDRRAKKKEKKRNV